MEPGKRGVPVCVCVKIVIRTLVSQCPFPLNLNRPQTFRTPIALNIELSALKMSLTQPPNTGTLKTQKPTGTTHTHTTKLPPLLSTLGELSRTLRNRREAPELQHGGAPAAASGRLANGTQRPKLAPGASLGARRRKVPGLGIPGEFSG